MVQITDPLAFDGAIHDAFDSAAQAEGLRRVACADGIAERNLYEKLKAYGLSRDDYR